MDSVIPFRSSKDYYYTDMYLTGQMYGMIFTGGISEAVSSMNALNNLKFPMGSMQPQYSLAGAGSYSYAITGVMDASLIAEGLAGFYFGYSAGRTTGSAFGEIIDQRSSGNTELKEVFNSIKDSQNYPEGFQARMNGTTSNKVNNNQLLDRLREVETGTWKKVYKDGYDAYGNKISIHYFQSQSGKVFDVKVKSGWSN